MSTRATVLLAVVFAALAAIYVVSERMQQRALHEAEAAKRVFDFAPDDVVSLSIQRVNEPSSEATRTPDGNWKILHPAETIPPNNAVWNRVAAAAATLSNERTIAEGAGEDELAAYELKDPFLSVIVGTEEGDVHEIEVGMMAATQDNRYARVGNRVILIPQPAVAELDRPLNDLRERHIILPGEDGITKLEYVRVYTGGDAVGSDGGPEIGDESVRIAFERNSDGAWRMTSPVDAPANQERVEALVTDLQYMVGRSYIDAPENLGDYGLNPPGAKITLHGDRSGEPRTLMLGWVVSGEESGGIYAKLEHNPAVFAIDGHLLSLLPETPDAFRETRLFTGEASNLKEIQLDAGEMSWRLVNTPDEGWAVVEPAVEDTDQEAVNEFMRFLKTLHGTSFPDSAEAQGLNPPATRLTLTYKDGETREIRVGAPVPDSNPVTLYATQDFGDVTTLPVQLVAALREGAFRFRDKRLLPFDPAAATKVSLQLDGIAYLFEKADGAWTISAPEGARLDSRSDVDALVRILAQAKATDIADPAPAREVQGVDAPVLHVSVEVAADSATQTLGPLRIGALKAEKARERFAVVEGRSETLFVDQALIDDLREALRGVRLPAGPPE